MTNYFTYTGGTYTESNNGKPRSPQTPSQLRKLFLEEEDIEAEYDLSKLPTLVKGDRIYFQLLPGNTHYDMLLTQCNSEGLTTRLTTVDALDVYNGAANPRELSPHDGDKSIREIVNHTKLMCFEIPQGCAGYLCLEIIESCGYANQSTFEWDLTCVPI